MGSVEYSVPQEAERLFHAGILKNPLISRDLPTGATEAAKSITFEGSAAPCIPINWRFAESISALKAYEAALINVLLQRKYGMAPVRVAINTDHAPLFFMSLMLWTIDPEDEKLAAAVMDPAKRNQVAKHFPDCDKTPANSFYRTAVTNIYRTKDGKYFHLHGSMNATPMLKALGLPKDQECASMEDAWAPLQEAVAKHTAEEMQALADGSKQAGTICWTTDEFKKSEHGQKNAHVGLFELHNRPNPKQAPNWWPSSQRTSAQRPLAGLKVVDMTRVIAAPAVTRGLAELGASVMRITAPHVTDMSILHPDLNHGKWNASLDLRKEGDRQRLRELILDADVFLQGYRPGILDKYGFGEQDILKMCAERDRGIIYACEDCYGWNGPWAHRSGWQQISDANCGVSYEYGRAMGNDEPVTPVFPNSDYCTGVAGVAGVLTALLRRGEQGGSYVLRLALNYYSQWLVNSVGMYPEKVWHEAWKRHGLPVFRPYHAMQYTLPRLLDMLRDQAGDTMFRPENFTQYHVKAIGKDMRIVAPILRFPDGEVRPGFDIGARGNSVDQPRWPDDLSVEVVE